MIWQKNCLSPYRGGGKRESRFKLDLCQLREFSRVRSFRQGLACLGLRRSSAKERNQEKEAQN
jgi:hypothetical protein